MSSPNSPNEQESRTEGNRETDPSPEVLRNTNGRGNVNPNEPDPAGASGAGRRDENYISFRHFLQPLSDVVPSSRRNIRDHGAMDLVDVAMALPDFVQDHLVPDPGSDHQSGHHPSVPVDLSDGLPDFASTQRNERIHRNHVDNGVSNGDMPHGQLPDFLSDGPMHRGTGNNVASASPSTVRQGVSGSCRSSSSPSGNGSESLQMQVARLARELREKDAMLSEVREALLARTVEQNRLYANLEEAQRALVEANERISVSERQVATLQREVTVLKDRVETSSSHTSIGSCPVSSENRQLLDSDFVMAVAENTESLISQLLQQIEVLKSASRDPQVQSSSSELSKPKRSDR